MNRFEKHRSGTFEVFGQISQGNGLPESAVIEFQFRPSEPEPDWAGFEQAVNAQGLQTECFPGDDTLQISARPIAPSAEAIWEHEQRYTLLAREFGVEPDGWRIWAHTR